MGTVFIIVLKPHIFEHGCVGETVDKEAPSYIVGGSVKWNNLSGEQLGNEKYTYLLM